VNDWDSDWSEPRIYGADDEALVSAGPSPAFAHDPAGAWSAPTYHGKRKYRPDLRPGPDASVEAPAVQSEPADDGAPADVGELREPAAKPAPEEPSLLASSRTMAIASLASRATGFLRTMAIAAALGTGANRIADAYNLANTLPNMVYELLLGGVLTSVIIPVLVKAQHDDDDDGVAYTQRLLSWATAGLGVATLLVVLAAPLLIALFGGTPSFRSLATLWATLLLPEIFFYGIGAMFSSVLNIRHVYGWPAWAPVLNNLITIAAVLLFLVVPGPGNLTTGNITNTQVLVLGVGTTLGIVAQALILLVPLRRSGFLWQWRFRSRPNEAGRMAEFRTLATWVLGYVAVSQVGVFAINRVANQHAGGVTTFANADLLFQVPYGILGVSLLTALMPRMSRSAARGDEAALLDDMRLGTRLSAVALVPISVGLIVLGPAFTSVILLGRFTYDGARLVGIALAAGAFGLLPFALVMLQQRVFYAMRDARTPTLINVAMVATKVAVLVFASSMFTTSRSVIISLTVATSLSYVAGGVAGHVLLRRRFGLISFRPVARAVGWISLASAVGGVAAWLVVWSVGHLFGEGRLSSLVALVVGGAVGGLVMIGVALRLPLPEVHEIRNSISGRAGRTDESSDLSSDKEPPDGSSDAGRRMPSGPLGGSGEAEIIERLRGED